MPKAYLERDTAGTPQQSFVTLPGGAQTISLLGPFGIDFDDADIGNGIGLADLDVGQLVVAAWAVVTVPFVPDDGLGNPAPGPTFVALAVGNPAGSTVSIGYYHADNAQELPSVANMGALVSEGNSYHDIVTNLPRPSLVVAATQLVVYVDGGSFVTGHADIYALVAESA